MKGKQTTSVRLRTQHNTKVNKEKERWAWRQPTAVDPFILIPCIAGDGTKRVYMQATLQCNWQLPADLRRVAGQSWVLAKA